MESIDCIVVGYNDIPFDRYVNLIERYGKGSEAYRDLKFSFIDLDHGPSNYVELLNHVVDAAAVQKGASARQGFVSGEIPNLAAVYLSNFLRRHGLTANYINLFQNEKEEFELLLRKDPLCVAITTTFYVLNFPVNEIVQFIRARNPRVKIVVGGPLIGNHLRNYSDSELVDVLNDIKADYYVVDSQGEATLAALVRCLKENRDPAGIPNLAYISGGRVATSPLLPETNSLDETDIDWSQFAREMPLGMTLQMRTARSCAFKCSFCNYPTRAGKLSLAGVETVRRELESIRTAGNIRNVVFIDDTFNVPLPRFKELCRMMIDCKFHFNWFSYFRCSNSDEEAFELMAESGCKGVFLGIESGSPAILKNMNKAASVERYAEGIKRLKEHGIVTFGSFITGFPGETDATVQQTIDFIRENKPDFYRSQIWYCEPGTPIFREKEKYAISGEGFVWEHATMSSPEAMDHIERMFLEIKESLWLPQWSFDFWFIPYFLGKGLSVDNFRTFLAHASRLLTLDLEYAPAAEKRRMQTEHMREMVDAIKSWPAISQSAAA